MDDSVRLRWGRRRPWGAVFGWVGAVSIAELRLLGRDWLIRQIEEAETQGVIARVWLANRPGILALDRFRELFPIDVLVTPPLDNPSLADRIRQDEISAVRQRMTGRRVVIAREDGTLEVDRR